MNYVDLSLIIFVILSAYIGWRRGILLSFLSMARALAGIPLAVWVGNSYSALIYKNYVRDIVFDGINRQISQSQALDEFTSNLSQIIGYFSLFSENDADLSILEGLNSQSAAAYVTDNIVEPIALQIVKIVLTILTFLIFYVITGIIISAFKKIREKKKLPLHNTNGILGLMFGLVKSAVLIIAVSSLCQIIVELSNEDNEFIRQLEGSVIFDFFNDLDLFSYFYSK